MVLVVSMTVSVRTTPNVIQKKEHVSVWKDGQELTVASLVHLDPTARTVAKHVTVKKGTC